METQQPQPLSKHERRELAMKKHRMKKITWWVIAVLIVGGSGYGIYYLASRPEKPRPGETFPILGQEHIAVGATHIALHSALN